MPLDYAGLLAEVEPGERGRPGVQVADEVGRSSYPWNGRRAPPPPVTKPVASGGGRHDRGARGDCHDTVVLPTEYARIESPEHRPEAAGDAMGLLPAA